jgi:hypothetical protein
MRLKMTLLENAYDFLNSSLLYYHYAQESENDWKIAFINLVQSLELMSKEKLRRSNKFLVFENIDRPKNTISLSLALDRMVNILGLTLEDKDISNIRKAIEIRNQMMHFEVDLSVYELKSKYSELFEFITSFHLRFLDGELHSHINMELWEEEASLMEFFKSEVVTYNNVEVNKKYPKEMMQAQSTPVYFFNGEVFPRIRFGDENYGSISIHETGRCHDCNVTLGQYHVFGCDWEQCPKCYGQAIGCGCSWREDSAV